VRKSFTASKAISGFPETLGGFGFPGFFVNGLGDFGLEMGEENPATVRDRD
jgi:hypothetical protein